MPRRYEDTTNRNVERGRSPDDSDDQEYLFDKDGRKNFVAKVYAILFSQLVITFGMIFFGTMTEQAREFMDDHFWVIWICMVPQVAIYLLLVCSEKVQRHSPTNFILLQIHTILFSVIATWISSKYELPVIWMAFLATAAITVIVSIFAKYSPWDVTGCGLVIYIAFMAMLVFSLIAAVVSFFIVIPMLFMIISGIMVMLLTFYLMFLTQLILGGRKGEFDDRDVVFAVIVLYVTIIEIFLHLLRLIQGCTQD